MGGSVTLSYSSVLIATKLGMELDSMAFYTSIVSHFREIRFPQIRNLHHCSISEEFFRTTCISQMWYKTFSTRFYQSVHICLQDLLHLFGGQSQHAVELFLWNLLGVFSWRPLLISGRSCCCCLREASFFDVMQNTMHVYHLPVGTA